MVKPPFQTAEQHLEDKKFSRIIWWIRENTPLDGILLSENAFVIRQQQHVHCHRKIDAQNACHNIPHGKTQKAFLQLLTINCNSDKRW